MKADEEEFIKVIKNRAEQNGNKIKVIDVAKKESEIEIKEVQTLHEVIEGLKEK